MEIFCKAKFFLQWSRVWGTPGSGGQVGMVRLALRTFPESVWRSVQNLVEIGKAVCVWKRGIGTKVEIIRTTFDLNPMFRVQTLCLSQLPRETHKHIHTHTHAPLKNCFIEAGFHLMGISISEKPLAATELKFQPDIWLEWFFLQGVLDLSGKSSW